MQTRSIWNPAAGTEKCLGAEECAWGTGRDSNCLRSGGKSMRLRAVEPGGPGARPPIHTFREGLGLSPDSCAFLQLSAESSLALHAKLANKERKSAPIKFTEPLAVSGIEQCSFTLNRPI